MTWQPLQEGYAHKNGVPRELPPGTTIWFNDQYIVHRSEHASEKPGVEPLIHLSIRNQDHGNSHNWRDFQRIKNQLAGPEYEGHELYPAESTKVDTANQYHLFCFPMTLGFGLSKERMVTDNDVTSVLEEGAVQSDNEKVDGPLNTLAEARVWKDKHLGVPE